MSYRRRLRSRSDIYWPAFVDIFVVLLAVSLLALPEKPPPGVICNPPNHCALPPKSPPSPIIPMRSEQFRAKRLSCRLDIALGELKPSLPNITSSGDSIRLKLPPPPPEKGAELSEEVRSIADHLKSSVFDSDLRSRWRNDPISLDITELAIQFDSGPEDQVAAPYAGRLHDYVSHSLATISEPVPVRWRGSVNSSTVRPQLFIVISTTLTDNAKTQAEADRQTGTDPCPSSPK